ncbi:MAG TPA: dihydroxy-acid dehydratase [Hyphomicrobiaceae bacterium]|nr:dihydroxy-acid dehydratase [Hyphomicrobiaceae bacterium]
MDARAFNKSKLHSRHGIEGPSRAPWWAHDQASGLSEAHILGPIAKGARDVCDIRWALGEGGGLNAAWLPVSDTTSAPTLENVKSNRDQEVVDPVAHPISARGNAVGLQGSRAPDGAIVKVAGMTRLQFRNRERDIITSEAEIGTLDLEVGEAGLGMRRNAWKAPANPPAHPPANPPANPYESGTLRKWGDQVGPVRAVAHAGSRAEVVGYADI